MIKVRDYLLTLKDTEDYGVTVISETGERFISYRQLYEKALHAGSVFRSKGAVPGMPLLLSISDIELFLYSFWGCVLNGFLPAPVSIDANRLDFAKSLLKICKTQIIVTDEHAVSESVGDFSSAILIEENLLTPFSGAGDEGSPATLLGVNDEEPPAPISTACENVPTPAGDTVCILFSSGSTSSPKGVGLTNKSIGAFIPAFIKRLDIVGKKDTALSYMPFTHTYSLVIAHLMSTYKKSNQFYMSKDVFFKNPVLWLESLKKFSITLAYCSNFTLNYLTQTCRAQRDKLNGLDLSHVSFLVGSEPLSRHTVENFLDETAFMHVSADALLPCYGLTEATAITAIGMRRTPVKYIRAELSSLFSPITYDSGAVTYITNDKSLCGVETCVMDFSGNDLGENVLGLIHIRGDNVLEKYYGSEMNIVNEGGWLDTGDVGFICNGEVCVVSRYKDLFFVNGQNYFCGDLDEAAAKLGLCEEVRFAGYRKRDADINDTVICFIKYSGENVLGVANAIAAFARDEMNMMVDRIVPVDEIQRTENGKVQRFKMLDWYLSGKYPGGIEPDMPGSKTTRLGDYIQEELERDILSVFRGHMKIDLDLDDNYIRLGVTSKDLTVLYTTLEITYRELVSVAELYEFQTIRSLSEYILTKNQTRRKRSG